MVNSRPSKDFQMVKLIRIIISISFAIGLQAHASDQINVNSEINSHTKTPNSEQSTLKPFYDQACEAKDSSCISVVEEFVRTEATQSTKRLDSIYRAYEEMLTDSERSVLKTEQATWSQTDLAQCHSRNESIDRWSCINWYQDQRSVELDRRLSDKLKDYSNNFRSVLLPISLRKNHLGVFAGTPALYALNFDLIELSQDTDGSYAFSFEVAGGNGHVCSGGGSARREGNLFIRVPEKTKEKILAWTAIEGLEGADLLNRSCKVEIKLFPNHIELEGNRECVEYFSCGTSLKGIFFRDSRASHS